MTDPSAGLSRGSGGSHGSTGSLKGKADMQMLFLWISNISNVTKIIFVVIKRSKNKSSTWGPPSPDSPFRPGTPGGPWYQNKQVWKWGKTQKFKILRGQVWIKPEVRVFRSIPWDLWGRASPTGKKQPGSVLNNWKNSLLIYNPDYWLRTQSFTEKVEKNDYFAWISSTKSPTTFSKLYHLFYA